MPEDPVDVTTLGLESVGQGGSDIFFVPIRPAIPADDVGQDALDGLTDDLRVSEIRSHRVLAHVCYLHQTAADACRCFGDDLPGRRPAQAR